MNWIRALAAVVLSLFLPGTGHLLIRDWVRALLFAGLFISTVALVMPFSDIAAAGSISEGISIVNEDSSRTSQFVLSFMLVFAAIDAGFRALGFPPGSNTPADELACPSCGRELDTDLEFCHWCTTRIEYPPSESEA